MIKRTKLFRRFIRPFYVLFKMSPPIAQLFVIIMSIILVYMFISEVLYWICLYIKHPQDIIEITKYYM